MELHLCLGALCILQDCKRVSSLSSYLLLDAFYLLKSELFNHILINDGTGYKF
jgi:hypothetical protein